eukprot:SAG11_NODE_757_length_7322_cov_32.976603_4_plen_690_part_00
MDVLVPTLCRQGICVEVPRPPEEDFGFNFDPTFHYQAGIPFPVPRQTYSYTSVVFPVPKPGALGRAVWAGRPYNKHVKKCHFKSDGVHTLRSLVRQRDYFCATDISDAYPSWAIHPHFTKHFIYRWRGRWFMYLGVVFGVTTAPADFTWLLKPLVSLLRMDSSIPAPHSSSRPVDLPGRPVPPLEAELSQGMRLIQFLDDFFICNQCPWETARHMHLLIIWLMALGYKIHPRKSVLVPTQIITWLGLVVDSVLFRLRLPRKRRLSIRRSARQVLAMYSQGVSPPLRLLASLLGRGQSASQCIVCIVLRMRNLMRLRSATLRKGRKVRVNGRLIPDWDQPVIGEFDDSHRQELLWLIHDLRLWNGKEILPLPPDLEVATDAAKTIGGGLVLFPHVGADQATALSEEVRWRWHHWELDINVNVKETATVEMGLRALDRVFLDLIYDVRILCNIDNMTGLSYINKQGGPFPHLSRIAERLWRWCLSRGVLIFCRHLAGVLNTRADRASRHRGDRSEWRLKRKPFNAIEAQFGPHSVDLMASRTNHLLGRYFSRWGDPSAAAHDAFQQDWLLEDNCYCHPPFIMIPLVLRHLVKTGATITLVAPVWPSHFWITMLVEFSVEFPLLLPRDLVEPASPAEMPATHCARQSSKVSFEVTQPKWRTAAWRLCAAPLSSVVWPRQQWSAFFGSGGVKL